MSALHEAMQSDDAASFWQHRFSLRTDMLPSFLDQELARKVSAHVQSLEIKADFCQFALRSFPQARVSTSSGTLAVPKTGSQRKIPSTKKLRRCSTLILMRSIGL